MNTQQQGNHNHAPIHILQPWQYPSSKGIEDVALTDDERTGGNFRVTVDIEKIMANCWKTTTYILDFPSNYGTDLPELTAEQ